MSRGADRGESDKGACRSQTYDAGERDHGDILLWNLSAHLERHENGRLCRVSCSKLPYVTAPTPQGAGTFFSVPGVGT